MQYKILFLSKIITSLCINFIKILFTYTCNVADLLDRSITYKTLVTDKDIPLFNKIQLMLFESKGHHYNSKPFIQV